jgi:hypothetical protein
VRFGGVGNEDGSEPGILRANRAAGYRSDRRVTFLQSIFATSDRDMSVCTGNGVIHETAFRMILWY